jgi:hypothetical protein
MSEGTIKVPDVDDEIEVNREDYGWTLGTVRISARDQIRVSGTGWRYETKFDEYGLYWRWPSGAVSTPVTEDPDIAARLSRLSAEDLVWVQAHADELDAMAAHIEEAKPDLRRLIRDWLFSDYCSACLGPAFYESGRRCQCENDE